MIRHISISLQKYGEALGFLFRKRLGWYFIFPLLLNILLLFGTMQVATGLSDLIIDKLSHFFENADFWGAETLASILTGSMAVIIKIVMFLLFAYVGGYIILIVMSPVLAFLSEATEKKYQDKDFPFDVGQFFKDIVRGVALALRNLLRELGLIILVWILSIALGWIPLIGQLLVLAGQIFLFLIAAYFYGFSFMDYTCERYRMNRTESVSFMKKNKWAVIGNGLPFAFLLMIPFGVGVFLSSFLAIVSVVAGTLTMLELFDKEGEMIKKTGDA